MRLLSAVLMCALTVPALADSTPAPAPSKFGLRVVKTMPESHQALLYDKVRNTHVLVEVGKAIDGFTVTEVEDDEVTMTGDNTSVILTAPAAPKAAVAPRVEAKKDAAPEDPYGEEKPREVEAPQVAEAKAPEAKPEAKPEPKPEPKPDAPKPVETPALQIDPAVAVVVPDKEVANPSELAISLAKADVTAALADFGKLAASVRGAVVANGIRIDKLAPGSMYAKVGLREGDIVTAIDGKSFKSVDDAADLYARAGGLKAATVVVVRNGSPLTLHVTIQ